MDGIWMDPLEVRCPYCDAVEGARCVVKATSIKTQVHTLRHQSVRRASRIRAALARGEA